MAKQPSRDSSVVKQKRDATAHRGKEKQAEGWNSKDLGEASAYDNQTENQQRIEEGQGVKRQENRRR